MVSYYTAIPLQTLSLIPEINKIMFVLWLDECIHYVVSIKIAVGISISKLVINPLQEVIKWNSNYTKTLWFWLHRENFCNDKKSLIFHSKFVLYEKTTFNMFSQMPKYMSRCDKHHIHFVWFYGYHIYETMGNISNLATLKLILQIITQISFYPLWK